MTGHQLDRSRYSGNHDTYVYVGRLLSVYKTRANNINDTYYKKPLLREPKNTKTQIPKDPKTQRPRNPNESTLLPSARYLEAKAHR